MSHFDKAEQELLTLENQREQLSQQLEAARAAHEAVQVDYRRAVGAVVLDGQPRSGDGGVSTVATERDEKADEVERLESAIETLDDRIEAAAEAAGAAKYLDLKEEQNALATRSHELMLDYGRAMLNFLQLAHDMEVTQKDWSLAKRRSETFRTKTEYDLPATDYVAPVVWGKVIRWDSTWMGHPQDMRRGINTVGVWLRDNE